MAKRSAKQPVHRKPVTNKKLNLTKAQKADVEYRISNAQKLLWDGNITETTALKEINAAARILRKATK